MAQKLRLFKKIVWGFLSILLLLVIGQIIVLAIESRTPSFEIPVKEINELIPIESSKVVLLSNLESETSYLMDHKIVEELKKLKLTKELFLTKEIQPIIAGIQKYSDANFDINMFYRFFGKESAISFLGKKDVLVIAKVDQLTMFLKQVAKTLSKYQILKKSIETTVYQDIKIEKLSRGKKAFYFTFIADYAFCSNNRKRLENVIDLAKGSGYRTMASNQRFKKALFMGKNKKYPVLIYQKNYPAKTDEDSKGMDRFKGFFKERFLKVAFKGKEIKVDYQYYYSNYGKKSSLDAVLLTKQQDQQNILKGFPRATAFYLTTGQLDSEKLYQWFINKWLVNQKELDLFYNTFKYAEKKYQVEIRKLIEREFGKEAAILLTGLGYQGFNPFPKLALMVKVNKKAKPVAKMRKIFKYMFSKYKLKKTRLQGIRSYYFQSDLRIGYNYSYNRANTTSKYKDFSPAFAYFDDYLIITFNKNTLNAILFYLKGAKGIMENETHQSFWHAILRKYPVKYYFNSNRIKEIATSYIEYLSNNQPNEYIYSDAKARLNPFISLLDQTEGAGGGFKLLKDKIKGELVIRLR